MGIVSSNGRAVAVFPFGSGHALGRRADRSIGGRTLGLYRTGALRGNGASVGRPTARAAAQARGRAPLALAPCSWHGVRMGELFTLHEGSFVLGLVAALFVVGVLKLLWSGAKLVLKLVAVAALVASGGGLYVSFTGKPPAAEAPSKAASGQRTP
jgi:hypothetical protein